MWKLQCLRNSFYSITANIFFLSLKIRAIGKVNAYKVADNEKM